MTAAEYADQVRELLEGAMPGRDVEPTVQALLAIRENDVRDLVRYSIVAQDAVEELRSTLDVFGSFVVETAKWVEGGMTRGRFPRTPK